jgi:hypothetical protein
MVAIVQFDPTNAAQLAQGIELARTSFSCADSVSRALDRSSLATKTAAN